ncbi:hypothetical protein ACIP9H_29710 [Streptomyces sp. NPDC088732]|uniref:hypothetical protein n=1 Tax=Streptomyces sp. NPDC088732 TaxID=3365879 RepID=UPI0038121A70
MVFEVRRVAITPVFKVYLINETQGLIGYYAIKDNEVRLADGDIVKIWDVFGLGAKLYRQGGEQREECREWFESLWTKIARSV